MNRIYQGRISRIELDGKLLPGWADALWDHHVLFQYAVNYYLVALAQRAFSREGGEAGRDRRTCFDRHLGAASVFPGGVRRVRQPGKLLTIRSG